jgi:type I restriction enzyme S subunit
MMQQVGMIPLGNLVELIMGQAPASKDCNFDGRGTPFVKVGEFGEIRPAIREWTTNPLRMARSTDVLLCVVGATCGKINLGENCAVGRSVAAIRPDPSKLDQFYLYYFMLTLVERLRSGSVGAAQTVISKEMVETVQVPFVPLPEQQRIVGILDDAFEGLGKATAHAERNLHNARALFESHLQSVFADLRDGWVERRLGDVCQTGAGGTPLSSKKTYYEGGNIPWLMSGEVSQGEILAATRFITKRGLENSSARMFPKDTVLVAMYGATAGQVGILRFEATTNQAVCGILPNDKFLPEFLFYALLSKKQQLIKQATGNAQPNISQIKIKNTQIPVIAKQDQQRIVSELDSLRRDTQRLESLYQSKLDALQALKKSLLHQAFTGSL